MLLAWLGERRGDEKLARASAIKAALDVAIVDPKLRTPDMGVTAMTDAFGAAVANRVSRLR
jgi:3-isopropylmalate dehydrogenase